MSHAFEFDLNAPPGQQIREPGQPDPPTEPFPAVTGSADSPLFAGADTVPAVAGVLAAELAEMRSRLERFRHGFYVLITDALRRLDEIDQP